MPKAYPVLSQQVAQLDLKPELAKAHRWSGVFPILPRMEPVRTFRGPQRDAHLLKFGEQILGSERGVSCFLNLCCHPVRDWPSYQQGQGSEPLWF